MEEEQLSLDLGGERDPRDVNFSDMVKEFAKVTDQHPDPFLYLELINEEFTEFLDAETIDNEVKELADLVYVVFGYAVSMGYDLEEAVRRVHENNLGRCVQPDGSVQRREDGKILKNKDFPKVNLEGTY